MMNTAQDAAIFTEGFADDDCTNERSGADWFKARAVPLPTFVGRPAEPARELAAAIQDAMARPQSFAAADELAQEQFAAKRTELLISLVLFSAICIGSVIVVLLGGSALFWTPIALGSLGVGGSSAIYLKQLRAQLGGEGGAVVKTR